MDRAKWKRRRGNGERGKFFQIIRFSDESSVKRKISKPDPELGTVHNS